MPTREDLTGAVESVRNNLPSTPELAYYGGLGLLGVFAIVEWPVVAAIGLGTALAQQSLKNRQSRQ